MTSIKLKPWLEELINKYSAASNKLFFEIKLNPEIKTIKADAQLLQSALNNLVDNASKYSPAGSAITIETLKNLATLVLPLQIKVLELHLKTKKKYLPNTLECLLKEPPME